MRSIFLKIFLWYWMALITGVIASIAVAMFFPSHTIVGQAKKYVLSKVTNAGQVAIEVYEQHGSDALDTFLERIEKISTFRLHLLDDQGIALGSAPLPAGGAVVGRKAITTSALQVVNWATHPLIAVHLTGHNGHNFAVVLEMSMGVIPYLNSVTGSHVLRLIAAIMATSLVCLLLARYLTTPIRKLQSAVSRFAKGDLSVRVSPGLGKRQDELADLGRDFDAMATQIESLMKTRERLYRDIAHELRSPLTRLNVAIELTRKHCGEAAARSIDRMAAESGKLSQLIGQLLTLSRLESAKHVMQIRSVSLEHMIERIAKDASFEGQDRNCQVRFQCEGPCTLNADGNLLRSAIENIVRNALRFTADGTTVEISQKIDHWERGTMAIILVRDCGPGVPIQTLPDLFQPFFRLAGSHDRSKGGAGLGLAIAYHAVKIHKGRITARNASQGGLVIEIALPIKGVRPTH